MPALQRARAAFSQQFEFEFEFDPRGSILSRRLSGMRPSLDTDLGGTSMNRYERKYLARTRAQERKKRLGELLAQVESPDERERAQAVRSLCPCRGPWPDSVWRHVAAACTDPSPLVRLQALHVLEDTHGTPHPNAYRLLRKAREDPDPRVARTAGDYIRQLRLRELRKQQL
jgi:hypothetical protein